MSLHEAGSRFVGADPAHEFGEFHRRCRRHKVHSTPGGRVTTLVTISSGSFEPESFMQLCAVPFGIGGDDRRCAFLHGVEEGGVSFGIVLAEARRGPGHGERVRSQYVERRQHGADVVLLQLLELERRHAEGRRETPPAPLSNAIVASGGDIDTVERVEFGVVRLAEGRALRPFAAAPPAPRP